MLDLFKPLKKHFLFFLLFLISISLVSAAQPTQTFIGDVGIEIKIPQAEFVKQNRDVVLHTHIYNASDGLPMDNHTASCNVHLYNVSGNHILQEDMVFNVEEVFDYELYINGDNFSTLGLYSFIIQCNTTPIDGGGIGGFVSGAVEVTEDGKAPPTEEEIIFNPQIDKSLLIMFAIFLIIVLLFIAIWKEDPHIASIVGFIMIFLGVYIMDVGFMSLNNPFSQGIAIIILFIGAYILLKANIENF